MFSNLVRARAQRRRSQCGAVVVEAALVITFFVLPMLVGVLTLGERLWHLQKHDPYEPRIYSSQVRGIFDCIGLVDRVKSTVANNISGLGVPIQQSWITVEVIEVDPTSVLVDVSVTVPTSGGSGDPVVIEAATRLENVSLTTITC